MADATTRISFRTSRISRTLIRPSNTTTYAAGDVISAVTTNDHYEFTKASRGQNLSGSIDSAVCISTGNETLKPDLELWLFRTDIAEVADNAAFAPTDTEILTLVGVVDFLATNWKEGLAGTGGNSMNQVLGLQLPFTTTSDQSKSLFGQLVLRNAYVPISAEEFTVVLTISKD